MGERRKRGTGDRCRPCPSLFVRCSHRRGGGEERVDVGRRLAEGGGGGVPHRVGAMDLGRIFPLDPHHAVGGGEERVDVGRPGGQLSLTAENQVCMLSASTSDILLASPPARMVTHTVSPASRR